MMDRFAKFRSAVPSRTGPTYLSGLLVVVVKCDLPTYPDGATGDNGPPIRQGAGTQSLNMLMNGASFVVNVVLGVL